jgi:predicted metal-binding membrane protein
LTLTLFVMGVMDLGAMALVGFAIGIERLVPQGERAARLIGVVMICGGWSAVMRVIA